MDKETEKKLLDGGFIRHRCISCGVVFYEVPDVRNKCENCIHLVGVRAETLSGCVGNVPLHLVKEVI